MGCGNRKSEELQSLVNRTICTSMLVVRGLADIGVMLQRIGSEKDLARELKWVQKYARMLESESGKILEIIENNNSKGEKEDEGYKDNGNNNGDKQEQ